MNEMGVMILFTSTSSDFLTILHFTEEYFVSVDRRNSMNRCYISLM